MSECNIGYEPEAHHQRDAVHVALLPVEADLDITPGSPVRLTESGGNQVAVPCERHEAIGIADPYRQRTIAKASRFWLFLFPNTIKSIRHDWYHPAVRSDSTASDPEGEHRRVIEYVAEELGRDYSDMMDIADGYVEHSDYVHMGEDERYKDCDWDAFWKAYKAIRKAEPKYGGAPFSCSC